VTPTFVVALGLIALGVVIGQLAAHRAAQTQPAEL
jgi:hypothetical protein